MRVRGRARGTSWSGELPDLPPPRRTAVGAFCTHLALLSAAPLRHVSHHRAPPTGEHRGRAPGRVYAPTPPCSP